MILIFSSIATNVKATSYEKNRIITEIVYCENSIKNKNGFYESYLYTENDDIYILNSELDIAGKWFVLVINDKGNDVFEDNIVIDIYNLDTYIF
ncbi:hypothetical protein K144316041_p21750 (plasmid) [Clostridium tetani]|uniref:hypothetical protein n=1 Tax=Clostridium tetani TaxID=1513 RepID=UPI0029557202|nr:hypothetical protein [Clostridium tetani]BDR74336.1 hypothetical protein K144316041_p21750 [Clostridium tetani]